MYRAEPDPYSYPGTTVLINRLGLRDQAALDAFEAEITAQRASEPFPAGRLSYRHYRAVHRHLFQDVYRWAGKIRTLRMSKNGNAFCYPEHIGREMRRLFGELMRHKHFRGLDTITFARKAAQLSGRAECNSSISGGKRPDPALISDHSCRAGRPSASHAAARSQGNAQRNNHELWWK
jgi:fido (protein-threonine AMPylation protein)